ncbi:MAG: apolipoprotein N-acyltransferase [Verrucomicrobia bacterium]|nr:apolipoprotein N-acyltransferase [Verrucomicrobiota bacterium]
MRFPLPSAQTRPRHGLALVAGLMLCAAFPKADAAGFAWAAPGLLLFAASGLAPGAAFRVGFTGGLAFHLASLYWLLYMPVAIGPIFAWLALGAWCALFVAVWVWLCWSAFPTRLAGTEGDAAFPGFGDVAAATWLERAWWALACAVLWVGLEFTLGRLLTGFPWLPLGVTQHRMLPVAQLASITGVHGVSFVLVWFAVALSLTLLMLARQPAARWLWVRELLAPALVAAAVCAFGFSRLAAPVPADRSIRLALVQPSIPQTLIFDPRETTNRFNKLIELSEAALATKPDLLVWPEAALPALAPGMHDRILELVRRHRVWLLLGADDVESRPGSDNPAETRYFNSAFLLDPDGKPAGRYRKQRLVIFGEYVPLVKWLPFLRHVTPIEGGFTPGGGPSPMEMTGPRARLAVLICFEDVFAASGREAASAGVDFLVNLTNDGWFNESAEQWQHAANASFRAVENGVPLVRCTNNGLTCWVDARGRMHAVYFEGSEDVYQRGFKTVTVPLPAEGAPRARTFYNRHGDWLGWSCVALTLAVAGMSLRRAKRP